MGKEEINLKIKLSRIYRIKKELVQELNNIRKELSQYVKSMFISESVPESVDFATFFRDSEYIRLNKILSEHVNLLEKPLTGDTEDIFHQEVENINQVISEAAAELTKTVKAINRYIQNLTGEEESVPVEQYINRIKSVLEKDIERQLKRELMPDIQQLKEKLQYIHRYSSYQDILNFLKGYEREVNLYLSQKGMEKVSKAFNSYKESLFNEVSIYLKRYIKSSETRKKVLEEIKKSLDEVKINRHALYYTLPDVSRHFAQITSSLSMADIITGNLGSKRFIGLFTAGVAVLSAGFLIPSTEVKVLTVLSGLALTAYSFLDSAFFNKHYLKKYIKEVREKIKEDVENSTDQLLSQIKKRILSSSKKAENLIITVIKRETRTVKEFENYLVNLRNRIEKHILNISNIKKELELELSEEE
ncbi:hypothetical protein [Persephonella sp.]